MDHGNPALILNLETEKILANPNKSLKSLYSDQHWMPDCYAIESFQWHCALHNWAVLVSPFVWNFLCFWCRFFGIFLWKMCFWSRGDADSNFYFSIFEAGWKICKYLDFVTWASNTQIIFDKLCHLLYLTISWNIQRRWNCDWNIYKKGCKWVIYKTVEIVTFTKRVNLWINHFQKQQNLLKHFQKGWNCD